MKSIEIQLYLVLGLVVLVVAAVAIFAMTFDPNRYKDDIQRIVKEKTGRTLEFKGRWSSRSGPASAPKVIGCGPVGARARASRSCRSIRPTPRSR